MAIGAALVWAMVVAIALLAARRRQPAKEGNARWLIVVGGMLVPTVVLAALLGHGLLLMPKLRAEAPADALRIHVSGEQWWWRVRYQAGEGGTDGVAANEISLPPGAPRAEEERGGKGGG